VDKLLEALGTEGEEKKGQKGFRKHAQSNLKRAMTQ
jgi:hypothetical protein